MALKNFSLVEALKQMSPQSQVARQVRLYDKIKPIERIFLEQNIGDLPPDTQQAVEDDNIQLVEADIYIRRKISTSGDSDLLDSQSLVQVGICNVDRTNLPEFQNLILSGIRVAFGSHATETKPEAILYANTSAPIPFYNGEIIITVNTTPIFTGRISRFIFPIAAYPNTIDYVPLKVPKLITSRDEINIKIRLPNGQTLATPQNFVEVALLGLLTRKKGR